MNSGIEGLPKRTVKESEDTGIEKNESLEQARAIVRGQYVSYENTREALASEGLLAQAVEEVRGKYSDVFEVDNEYDTSIEAEQHMLLTNKDWEMLAVLWLFDEKTAHHSVETYRIARDKVTKPLLGNVVLAKEFTKEGVSLEQFFRACLFHDIGKLAIPLNVLTDSQGDTESAALILACSNEMNTSFEAHHISIGQEDLEKLKPTELVALLHEKYALRPANILPIRFLLKPEQSREIGERLASYGLSTDSSLTEVMRIHEKVSQEILENAGMPVEAELVGSHHTRNGTRNGKTPYTITIGTLQITIDIADIIHLADVEQAMGSERHYKRPESSVSVLDTLVRHAQRGLVQKELTYLWVADELLHIDKTLLDSAKTKRDTDLFAHIRVFIDKMQKEIGEKENTHSLFT